MIERIYNVADALLDTLSAHGVTHIFGYPGGAILPFYDALPFHKNITHILVRHEQGAAFMAEGWARSTKKIGVCCATSGPGATNLVTGLADAMMDSVPILAITGQVPLPMIGKDMFQETDMTGVTMSITKHNYLVENPDDIVNIVTEAIKVAISGRPGPVHIDIPKDVMASPYKKKFFIPEVDYSARDPMLKAYEGVKDEVKKAIILALTEAKRPMLLVGHGVKYAHAEEAVSELIKRLGIPTVTTLLAKGIIDPNNPYYLGVLGMHGFYHSNMAMHEADLILNIGSRFDDRIVGRYDTFGKQALVIHVDIDKSELNKLVETQIPVHSDAKVFIEGLLKERILKKLKISDWWKQIKKWKNEHPYERNPDQFNIRFCLAEIQKVLNQDPKRYILVTDVGQHQMFSMLSFDVPSSVQWLTSGGAGSMGFGFPAAIGAAFANPDKTVICITGDGGFQMNIQELGVVAKHNLDVKICVLNNSYLGMVRQWQQLFYENNYSAVELTNPDYEKIAEAYGIAGYLIKNGKDIQQFHQKIFGDRRPCLVDYQVVKEDNVFPMVPGGKTLAQTIVG